MSLSLHNPPGLYCYLKCVSYFTALTFTKQTPKIFVFVIVDSWSVLQVSWYWTFAEGCTVQLALCHSISLICGLFFNPEALSGSGDITYKPCLPSQATSSSWQSCRPQQCIMGRNWAALLLYLWHGHSVLIHLREPYRLFKWLLWECFDYFPL